MRLKIRFLGITYFHCLGFILVLIGLIIKCFNMALLGIICAWLTNMFFGAKKLKNRIMFFLFNLSYFFFLLGQIVVRMFKGIEWWKSYTNEAVIYTMICLYLGIVGLNLGAVMCTKRIKNNENKTHIDNKKMQTITIVLMLLVYPFALIVELERAMFMIDKPYTAIFLDFSSNLPFIVQKLAIFFVYFVIILFALKPNKFWTYFTALLYLSIGVIEFIVGIRTTFMTRLAVIVAYIIIRHYEDKDKGEIWINKFMKISSIIGIPILFSFLAILNYIREGFSYKFEGILSESLNLIEAQGISIITIFLSYENKVYLEKISHIFTLGPIRTLINNEFIGKIIGMNSIKPWTIEAALSGNSLTYSLMYVINKNEYLSGRSYGSSYIAECGLDFGYIGILVISAIFGMLLIYLQNCSVKSWKKFTISLFVFQEMIMIPRSMTLQPLSFLLSPYIYLSILTICIIYKVFNKKMLFINQNELNK